MKIGGRLQGAIEVLDDVLERRTPIALALRDWGKAHRFAGSKDRAAIGNIAYDALRQRQSLAWKMDDDSARAVAIAAICQSSGLNAQALSKALSDDKFSPTPLTATERARIDKPIGNEGAPDWVKADVPEWVWPAFENNFADEAILEGRALSQRPPMDLRANTIKATRESVIAELAHPTARPTRLAENGIRFEPSDQRFPNIQSDAVFQTGRVEIQDEGSQIVSALVNAKPGDTILDYCAGGGGKALAMAADMDNTGAIHAYDIDKRRLTPLYQRAMRAGADIIHIEEPQNSDLSHLVGKMDRVLIDAPCTGVGTWRRKPDAKWRLTEAALSRRLVEQGEIIRTASQYVRPGGFLFYVTCSMLAEENEAQIYSFLEDNEKFSILSAGEVWEEKYAASALKPWSTDGCSLTMTPASTQTDGFFFSVLERRAN